MSTEKVSNTTVDTPTVSRRLRRQMIGIVTSTKGAKTAVVAVTRTYLHPQYRKYVRQTKKYAAHDEAELCNEGDRVMIEECRPVSKRKNWRLRSVLRAAK